MNVMNDFIQSSPSSMSPNNNGPNSSGMDDSRKAPPPIGTERHNFNKYNSNCYQQYPGMTQQNDMDFSSVPSMMNQIAGMPPPNNSWMDKNPQQQWQMQSNVAPRNNNPYDSNDYNMTPDLFQV